MSTSLTIRSIFIAAVLGSGVSAYPLSLGPVSGSAVIGRPLQLSAPIELDDAVRGSGSGCATAEVMYGERAVSSSSIKVDVSADGRLAQIFSSTLVDEPFVTLLLHAGCGMQSTRRYVLLAEAPQQAVMELETATSLDFGAGATTGLSPVLVPAVKTFSARRPGKRAAAGNRLQLAALPGPVREAGRKVLRAGGRLQLAAWEPGSEVSPWLRASTELLSMPNADSAHRAAATALWRALNAQPQDLLRTAERLRGLEGEVISLRGLEARHRTEILSARDSLLESRTQRYTNLALVMSLALLAGGGAALFWHRSRRAAVLAPFASWYPPLEPQAEPQPPEEQSTTVTAPVVEEVFPAAAPAARSIVPQTLDIAPTRAEPAPALLAPIDFSIEAPPVAEEASGVDLAPARLKVHALHDAQQQSEFFASLGQFDEAIAVLCGYLEESTDRPVLAYLELFRLYHGLERRGDYEALQSAFRSIFGIEFTGFDDYSDEVRELDLYLVPVSRLSASWPSQASLVLIEKFLFNRPATARELLSVDAYRELVWLYNLAQDILQSTRLPAGLQLVGGTDLPNDHFILPWAFGEEPGLQELSLDRLSAIDVAPQLSGFAVDIDLTAAPGHALQQSRIDDGKAGDKAREEAAARKPLASVTDSVDAFDAVMEFHSHKNAR